MQAHGSKNECNTCNINGSVTLTHATAWLIAGVEMGQRLEQHGGFQVSGMRGGANAVRATLERIRLQSNKPDTCGEASQVQAVADGLKGLAGMVW